MFPLLLLCRASRTFGLTRSGTVQTNASWQLPLFRALQVFQSSQQGRLHPLPPLLEMASGREGVSERIDFRKQPATVEVALDELGGSQPTYRAAVSPLGEWLLRVGSTRMTKL